jgi:hypothetical protein
MHKPQVKLKMTRSVQEAREESFERVINDSVKARQRNFNVTMRDKFHPGDEMPIHQGNSVRK